MNLGTKYDMDIGTTPQVPKFTPFERSGEGGFLYCRGARVCGIIWGSYVILHVYFLLRSSARLARRGGLFSFEGGLFLK